MNTALRIHHDDEAALQKDSQVLRRQSNDAWVYQQVFTQHGKRFSPTMQAKISRARTGAQNPSAQIKDMLRADRLAGGTMRQHLLLVADLDAFVRGLHGESLDCMDSTIRQDCIAETMRQGLADVAEMSLMDGITANEREDAIKALLEHVAAVQTLVAKLVRRREID